MAPGHLDPEGAIRLPGDINHVLPGTDIETVMLRDSAIVNEPVLPGGLLVAGDERNVADLDPLGGGEECHRQWIALDGGHDSATVEQHAGKPRLLGRDPHRESARPRANDQQRGLFHFTPQ